MIRWIRGFGFLMPQTGYYRTAKASFEVKKSNWKANFKHNQNVFKPKVKTWAWIKAEKEMYKEIV